ncbi:MAG: type II secretion system GspH family protein [Candidatus Magasanikbacteria bacterium]|nr:type II secretion system GspH family protein [Candidatus Magasanikbacteria bacterium]
MYISICKTKGFTLLEMVLVISLLGIIIAVSAPIYSVFQTKNDVDLASEMLKTSLYRAQILSRNMIEDDNWSVHIENEDITVFKGTDYPTRDLSFEEITKMSARVIVSGTTDIIFSKFTGDPQNIANIELTIDNETKTITINEKGVQGN